MIAHIESTAAVKNADSAEALTNRQSPGTVDGRGSNPVSADDGHREYVPTAKAFGGIRLDDLPRHESVLERRKKEALEKNEPRKSPTRPIDTREPLNSILRPHLSRLEREKLEYCADNETTAHVLSKKKHEEPAPALEEVFSPHVCVMEKRKKDAALTQKYAPSLKSTGAKEGSEPESLDLKKHVGRLEREKMAQRNGEPVMPVQRRKSRLEMEKEAIDELYN
ncbi:hypothetical protein M9435_002368 [Picochlorum sp. BPE23]|nr:hypothetical protein M9435_002368 [Picochlorum sp. BPE23]